MDSPIIFTIISKNYLSYARVFTQSFHKYHPNIKVFVLLVDELGGYINPKKENFEIIEVSKIGIRNFKSFAFKYNILELNTAVKSFFIEYLFKKYKFNKILYFDPDILVINNLNKLFEILDHHSILLIPHITKPINDNYKPGEINFLKSGSYNLGFIGLANTGTTKNFLKWWQERVYDNCLYKVENGLFVDQKWIDLVPSFYNDYYILYEPGYNVAYWNLQERRVVLKGESLEKATVNNKHLYFFHFSGFDPEREYLVSKHQNRFSLRGNLKNLKPLFDIYKNLLFENGYKETKNLPYVFGMFDNGVRISDFIRRIYFYLSDSKKAEFKNPFSTKSIGSFYNWLISPRKGKDNQIYYISNLLYEIYQSEPKLTNTFPDIFRKDRNRYIEWMKYQGRKEYGIDKEFLKPSEPTPTKDTVNGLRFTVKVAGKKILNWIYYSRLLQENKFLLRRVIGDEKFYKIRNLVTSVLWGFPRGSRFENANPFSGRSINNKFGLNIAGHITAESGTGEAVRSNIKSAKRVKIPLVINNFEINVYRKEDKTFKKFSFFNPYKFNLIHVNSDQTDVFYKYTGPRYFQEKYNIGYWLWEQSTFPKEWLDRFKYFNEIWTASSFAVDSISKVSPIPVIRVPLSVEGNKEKIFNRKDFSLPEGTFIYLFIFDFLSVFERKNPLAIIEAFSKSFSEKDNALLLLKTVNSKYNAGAFQELNSRITTANIRLFDGYLSKDRIDSLINISDCYVSLHRSEGFGYPLFEAMYSQKPVIATSYSGNMDVMNINNSFLVKYKIVELEKDYGPYKKGTTWADPDTDHAAELMRYVYENRNKAKAVGSRASLDVKSQLSHKTIGELIRGRLQLIG